jgi:hypothetical protein
LATHHELLHKIRGRGTALRTSPYADDAAVFVAPCKEDIQNLANILALFGEVTGLETNFQKIMVVPICCQDIELEDVLEGMLTIQASFPMKYLDLPLSICQLKEWNSNRLKTRWGARLLLGTEKTSTSRAVGPLSNPFSPRKPFST